jgi:serine/threonine-protein kinase RsbW
MLSGSLIRLAESRLSVEIFSPQSCVVAVLRGVADHAADDTLSRAADVLITAVQPRVVLELHAVERTTPAGAVGIARIVQDVHRLGKEVQLVRCSEELFTHLVASGLPGGVRHAGSLAAATDGTVGEAQSTLSLHLRSQPEHLRRVRAVLGGLAQRLALSEEEVEQVRTAVGEACTNAIVHGSPHGPRNHVAVSFHLTQDAFVIDVADEGPGFNPGEIPPPCVEEMPEHGYGIFLMRQLMDRLEYYRDPGGTLVRLTKFLNQPVAA